MPAKLANVRLELDLLEKTWRDSRFAAADVARDERALQEVNERLWDIEDRIREKEARQTFDREFIELARAVYHSNDERAAIKKRINLALGSRLVEEKSYQPYRAGAPGAPSATLDPATGWRVAAAAGGGFGVGAGAGGVMASGVIAPGETEALERQPVVDGLHLVGIERSRRKAQLHHAGDVGVTAGGVVGLRLDQRAQRIEDVDFRLCADAVARLGRPVRRLAGGQRLLQRLHVGDSTDDAQIGIARLLHRRARGLLHGVLGGDPLVLGLMHTRFVPPPLKMGTVTSSPIWRSFDQEGRLKVPRPTMDSSTPALLKDRLATRLTVGRWPPKAMRTLSRATSAASRLAISERFCCSEVCTHWSWLAGLGVTSGMSGPGSDRVSYCRPVMTSS